MRKTAYKLKRLMKSKKAVSPVIAIILLIAIAVAASVTVFAYTQGIIGGVTQANLVLSDAEIITSDRVKLIFQNTGGTSLEIDQIDLEDNGAAVNTDEIRNAITGELIDADGGGGFDTNLVIDAGTSVAITMERTGGTWVSGDVVTVQIWLSGNTGGTPDYETDFEL